ncbi:ABC transporter [Candidatus Palibaumannia cicadellinicola]|uniref:ABC transporter n=1 Tax=Candidatus Palibaumannia cicadellinicola TaxID=186490 RepID=A0A2N4XWS2_9GAMM|nr:ATP-binding cassette domain-containing protein [Candidatus Baumannia cicadellinicola]PLK58590.1 ABC transporter [Candidatus Baumannia cicadellinicola]
MESNNLVINVAMIRLHNLLTGYKDKSIGKPVSGIFERGSMTAIIGVNGSGKSTLLKTIAGLLPPVGGKIDFGAEESRPYISYLPQQIDIDRQFPLKVFEVVSIGCWPATSLLRSINAHQQTMIWQALILVGLDHIAHCTICSLSNGQFQRMLFARLLVQQAPIILLDEPFTAIDQPTCNLLITFIHQLHKQGSTIIVVLHDNILVANHFPQTLLLSRSNYAWGPSTEILMKFQNCTVPEG